MAIHGLQTKYNGEFYVSELFKELDQIWPAETHWTFISPAAMIGIALAIFLIGMLIWKKCFGKPSSMETTPPAPSAPPMPIHNQPQKPCKALATKDQATKSNASIPSTSHERTPWRKGEILEQYSKRHQRRILIRRQAGKLFFCK